MLLWILSLSACRPNMPIAELEPVDLVECKKQWLESVRAAKDLFDCSGVSLRLAKSPNPLGWRVKQQACGWARQAGGLFGRRKPEAYATVY